MNLKRISFLSSTALLLLTACESVQDVPVPEDENAKAWSAPIKESYPEWQPTKEVPKSNPEYDQIFTEEGRKKYAPPAPKTEPEFQFENEQRPAFPPVLLLEILADNTYKTGDSVITEEELINQLKKIADAYPEKSTVILNARQCRNSEKIREAVELCKTCRISHLRLVKPAATAQQSSAKTSKPAANVKTIAGMTVDTSKEPQTYTVGKNDTLSGISLKFYKNARYSSFIFDANRDSIKSSKQLRVGQTLKIPALKQAEK